MNKKMDGSPCKILVKIEIHTICGSVCVCVDDALQTGCEI